jgi:hypothetical protein
MTDKKSDKTIEQLKAEVEQRSHPAAKVFALLTDADPNAWEKLCTDVRKNGLQNRILIEVLVENRQKPSAHDTVPQAGPKTQATFNKKSPQGLAADRASG